MSIESICIDEATKVTHATNQSADKRISAMREMRQNLMRPTDRELLAAIESVYSVSAPVAFKWLQNINMKALQAELIKEIK